MAATFPLRIVSPERVTWEGDAQSMTLPAWEGSLGILPGHAPLLAQLREGVVRIRPGEGEERLLAVSGGFVEVSEGKVSLFAETAELAEEIDAERARQALEKARAAARPAAGAVIDEVALAALRRAFARLRAAELAAHRSTRRPAPHE